MYCTKCGRELPGGGTCVCGQQYPAAQNTAPPTETEQAPYSAQPMPSVPNQPFGQAPQPPAPGYIPPAQAFVPPPVPPPFSPAASAGEPPAVAVLRRITGSSLALAAFCLQTIGVALSFLSGLLDSVQVSDSTTIISVLLVTGPSIVTCIGFWLFYRACKGPAYKGLSTTGLTVSKTGLLILFIIISVALAVVGIACILLPQMLMGTQALEAINMALGRGLFTSLGVILLLVAAFLVVFMVFAAKTLQALVNVVRTGVYHGGVSMFLIVVLYIFAGSNFITVMRFQSLMQIPSALISGVSMLLLGLLLYKLRSELSRLPLSPVTMGAGYPGFPPYGGNN